MKKITKSKPLKKPVSPLESAFQRAVINKLKKIPDLYFFKKEAMAIRGIPDIIGCYKGRFFAWELKRSEAESHKMTGRIVLQKYIISLIRKAGGIGEFVYPENFEERLEELTLL